MSVLVGPSARTRRSCRTGHGHLHPNPPTQLLARQHGNIPTCQAPLLANPLPGACNIAAGTWPRDDAIGLKQWPLLGGGCRAYRPLLRLWMSGVGTASILKD